MPVVPAKVVSTTFVVPPSARTPTAPASLPSVRRELRSVPSTIRTAVPPVALAISETEIVHRRGRAAALRVEAQAAGLGLRLVDHDRVGAVGDDRRRAVDAHELDRVARDDREAVDGGACVELDAVGARRGRGAVEGVLQRGRGGAVAAGGRADAEGVGLRGGGRDEQGRGEGERREGTGEERHGTSNGWTAAWLRISRTPRRCAEDYSQLRR
jgi:hypothetical protein